MKKRWIKHFSFVYLLLNWNILFIQKELNEEYFDEDDKEEEESILDLTKEVKKRSLIKQKKELDEFYLNIQIFFDQIASFFERIIK